MTSVLVFPDGLRAFPQRRADPAAAGTVVPAVAHDVHPLIAALVRHAPDKGAIGVPLRIG